MYSGMWLASLKMEAAGSYETLLPTYQIKRCSNGEHHFA